MCVNFSLNCLTISKQIIWNIENKTKVKNLDLIKLGALKLSASSK